MIWCNIVPLSIASPSNSITDDPPPLLWNKLSSSRRSNDPINHIYPVENSFWCGCVSLCRWHGFISGEVDVVVVIFPLFFFWWSRVVAGMRRPTFYTSIFEFDEPCTKCVTTELSPSQSLVAYKNKNKKFNNNIPDLLYRKSLETLAAQEVSHKNSKSRGNSTNSKGAAFTLRFSKSFIWLRSFYNWLNYFSFLLFFPFFSCL